VRVKEATFSDDPMSAKALAGRCIATLDYWPARRQVCAAGRPDDGAGESVPGELRYGDTWFVTTWHAGNGHTGRPDCSSSTLAAFFLGTRGQIGDLDFALTSSVRNHYLAWEIRPDRNDHPDAARACWSRSGSVRRSAFPDEKQAAEDEIEAERAGEEGRRSRPPSGQRRIKVRKLQKLVNKMREGDCVQGWIRENDASLNSDDRNAEAISFFVVGLRRDAGNVSKYTILTANSGGVSRKEIAWNTYADPRIGRLYKIEGE